MAMTSARERQQVYDKLGLKPWEIAQAEAEYNRGAKLREMSALSEQFGAPKDVTLGKEFTMPDMSRRTFSEGGEQRAIELSPLQTEGNIYTEAGKRRLRELYDIRMAGATGQIPENYKTMYSPQDLRMIEKLQQARSEAATNPELEEYERQSFYDRIDAQISKVPRLSPMMKERTAQQKVDASTVEVDGIKYFYNGESLKPINAEADKAKAELNKAVQSRQKELYNQFGTEDDKRIAADDMFIPRSPGAKTEQALTQARIEYGLQEERWPSINPVMDGQWEAILANSDVYGGLTASRMTSEVMDRHIEVGKRRGLSTEEAKNDLLQRWLRGTQGGVGYNKLPRMNEDIRKKINFVNVDTNLSPNDQDVADTLYGGLRDEPKVTVHPDVPKELDIYWGSLSNEDKRAVRQALDKGVPLEDIIADIRSELGLNT